MVLRRLADAGRTTSAAPAHLDGPLPGAAAREPGGIGRRRTMAILPLVLVGACESGDAPGGEGLAADWQAQVDTVADTVAVHTVEGSEWGGARLVEEVRIGALEGEEHEEFGRVVGLTVDEEGAIYVFDRQAPALRVYEPDGSYRGTLGGEGSGPGEYGASDGGLVVLEDGRVVLRDPSNGRFNVYAPDGEPIDHWPGPRNQYVMGSPIVPAADGGFYNPVPGGGFAGRYARFERDGTVTDTLQGPQPTFEPAQLTAESEQALTRTLVPFTPFPHSTFHPDGHFVTAATGEYAIDLHRADEPILRLSRDVEPVPVSPEERRAAREHVLEQMRGVDPDWSWDGPEIPETKPPVLVFHTGLDGRVWVQLTQPGEPADEEDAAAGTPASPTAPPGFQEPVVYDVFEPDGRYLGQVEAPDGFSPLPVVFRGDHVWAVTRDEWDVEYVVRYRVERAER